MTGADLKALRGARLSRRALLRTAGTGETAVGYSEGKATLDLRGRAPRAYWPC